MRKIISMLLILMLTLTVTSFAEDNNYKIDVDGKLVEVDENFDNTVDVEVNEVKIKFKDAKPFINKEERTVVPVRFIAEALGAEVDWNGETRTVLIDQDERHIELKIGAMEATVNSEIIKFDTKAEIYFDRTFVPLRFVSEALGSIVGWNGETRTVTIDTKTNGKEEQVESPKNVEEMIAVIEDEELKEVVKTIPNIQIGKDNNVILYDEENLFEWNTIDIDIDGATANDPTTLITVYPTVYDDYSILKEMLKVYYPTQYETVYEYVSGVIEQEEYTKGKAEEFVYDNRSFACAKGEMAISIYIGGKANE